MTATEVWNQLSSSHGCPDLPCRSLILIREARGSAAVLLWEDRMKGALNMSLGSEAEETAQGPPCGHPAQSLRSRSLPPGGLCAGSVRGLCN